jgi:hypothetical protein
MGNRIFEASSNRLLVWFALAMIFSNGQCRVKALKVKSC